MVPIPYTADTYRLQSLFAGVNGLLYTGGGADITVDNGTDHGQYFRAAQTLWELALAANARGEHFPIWGTWWVSGALCPPVHVAQTGLCIMSELLCPARCSLATLSHTALKRRLHSLGFQTVSVLASGNRSLLSKFSGVDGVNLPLKLVQPEGSRLFGHAPARVIQTLAQDDATVNLHHWGVAPAAYSENPKLASFFRPLSTNVDTSVSEARRLACLHGGDRLVLVSVGGVSRF